MWETSLYQINHNFYFFDLFRDIPWCQARVQKNSKIFLLKYMFQVFLVKHYKTVFLERHKGLTWKTHTVDHNSNTIKYQKAGINFMLADLTESK